MTTTIDLDGYLFIYYNIYLKIFNYIVKKNYLKLLWQLQLDRSILNYLLLLADN